MPIELVYYIKLFYISTRLIQFNKHDWMKTHQMHFRKAKYSINQSINQETSDWMKSNRLQSNPDKAEIMWCATSRRQHQLPTTALSIDGAAVDPVKSVRDLGIYISTPTWSCGRAFTGQYRDVTPHSVNYARFAVPYHHQRSSHWLSPWCFPGWTMEMPYWSAYRPT